MSNTGSKGKPNKKTSKPANVPFKVFTDFKIGDAFPEVPPQFASEFRLLRQLVRWAKRYGVLRDGRLHIYVSKQDMERNHAWRTIDLARSVVSYRNSDFKFVINSSEPSPEIFRLKSDKEKHKQWVDNLRNHRYYGQAKLAPKPQVAKLLPPVQVIQPSISEAKGEEAIAIVAALDQILNRLEENINTEKPQQDPRTLQSEYLNSARDAQSKLHALLGLAGLTGLKKWQPIKPKKQLTPTPAVPTPSSSKQPKTTIVAAIPPNLQSKTVPLQSENEKKPVPPPTAPPTVPTPAPKAAIAKPATTILKAEIYEKPPPIAPSPPPSRATSSVPTVTQASSPMSSVPASTVSSGAASPSAFEHEDDLSEHIDNVPDQDVPEEKSDSQPAEEALSPSPAKVPVYRLKLPALMGPQPSIFRIAMAAIGRDVMQFSLPAAIMEPLSLLQIGCEELEYSELIDQAVASSNPNTRMMYVACFACARYGSTAYRTGRKPFNPLLGQTFEFDAPHLGWRFLGEQVQHHPSVSALYAEGRGWRWWQDSELIVSFGGSSLDAKPAGQTHLYLEKYKETYQWAKVSTQISGLLSGTYTIDHYGEMNIRCFESKMTAKMQFKKMASKDRRGEIEGKVMDAKGKTVESIHGNWNDALYSGEPGDTTSHCVWRLAALPPDYAKYYGMTRFAMTLNEIRPEIHGAIPKTDSRYRPDQKALEMGKAVDADKIKKDLEDRQRKRRKEVEAGKRKAPQPLWFQPTGNKDPNKGERWHFNNKYWKSKAEDFNGITFLPLW